MKDKVVLILALLASAQMIGCYGDLPALIITATEDAQPPTAVSWSDEEDLGYLDEGRTVEEANHVNAIRQFFMVADIDGVAPGFDLDGIISPEGDEDSCGHGDLTSPDGREGIDNQFAEVWSAAEALVGEAIVALLLDGINEGRMLVLIELSHVDDLVNDDDVTLTVRRSQDQPIVSMAGYLVPDQTFALDDSFEAYVFEGASIVDGHLIAGPFDFAMPILAFNADFIIPMRDGFIELTIHDDGEMEGFMGGKIDVEDTIEKFLNTNASQEAALIAPIVRGLADLSPNSEGACTEMSGALRFEGTNAFIVNEGAGAQSTD